MKVEFNNLPPTQELTIVTLGDYFGGEGAEQQVLTKEEFIADQLDGGDYSFEEFMEGSGDGADNFIVLTIWNGKIAIVDVDGE